MASNQLQKLGLVSPSKFLTKPETCETITHGGPLHVLCMVVLYGLNLDLYTMSKYFCPPSAAPYLPFIPVCLHVVQSGTVCLHGNYAGNTNHRDNTVVAHLFFCCLLYNSRYPVVTCFLTWPIEGACTERHSIDHCVWLIFHVSANVAAGCLNHLSLDKMAAILQTIFSDAFSWMKSFCILIKISLKFVPKGLIDNNQAWFR